MPIDFNNRFKKISFSQIDLKEFLQFYKEICQCKYTYTLENKKEIVVLFQENNFSHLLGLHKFKKIKAYKYSNDINKDIEKDKITFELLMEKEPTVLNNELKDRMMYFPVLKTLLENTDTALEYKVNVIWNSKIEFSFLLKTEKITVAVYLAVKELSENKVICVPVSFLVDRREIFSKLNLEKLNIMDRKIIKK